MVHLLTTAVISDSKLIYTQSDAGFGWILAGARAKKKKKIKI